MAVARCRWTYAGERQCKFTCTDLNALSEHVVSQHATDEHVDPKAHFACGWPGCAALPERFSGLKDCCLARHMRTHAPAYGPWACSCGAVFLSYNEYEDHQRRVHKQCALCGKYGPAPAFPDMPALLAHYRTAHHVDTPHVCRLGHDFECDDYDPETEKRPPVRGERPPSNPFLHGDEDKKKKKKRRNRYRAPVPATPAKATFRCQWDDCRLEYKKAQKLAEHVDKHIAAAVDSKPPADNLTCKWGKCTRTFTEEGWLELHLSSDHLARAQVRYYCKRRDCPAAFQTQQQLDQHAQSHEDAKRDQVTRLYALPEHLQLTGAPPVVSNPEPASDDESGLVDDNNDNDDNAEPAPAPGSLGVQHAATEVAQKTSSGSVREKGGPGTQQKARGGGRGRAPQAGDRGRGQAGDRGHGQTGGRKRGRGRGRSGKHEKRKVGDQAAAGKPSKTPEDALLNQAPPAMRDDALRG
ncbi:hypothetical protein EXIGLDRAFT_776360 [Exidia glandulosa HHB12029]|uniref:C2H2-type domain-containing protein n=1 Tax=Exidia glandulosa HHB12029 TaxID=1314781 RepID=A0A165ZPD4_EXIGL|nr:hypothetical protein EXIGLDRAFT_776360 [Exidia glandulosa HHB12029]